MIGPRDFFMLLMLAMAGLLTGIWGGHRFGYIGYLLGLPSWGQAMAAPSTQPPCPGSTWRACSSMECRGCPPAGRADATGADSLVSEIIIRSRSTLTDGRSAAVVATRTRRLGGGLLRSPQTAHFVPTSSGAR